jgi:hypothetical protein
MDDYYYYRRQLARDEDLRETVGRMLAQEGYEFNDYPSVGEYNIDFVAWKPDTPDHVIITLAAGTADLTMVGRILALLGRYRDMQNPNARAWIIARDFTSGAWDAAKVCPDLTLKWYQASVSIIDAQKPTATRPSAEG